MRTFLGLTFMLLIAANVFASDYVGRAKSSCEPLKGRSGYDQCIASAARDICDGLQSPYDRLACSQDFERYYSAQVQSLENQRKEAAENTQRLIEQMQMPSQ
jgi:hypothetical protein